MACEDLLPSTGSGNYRYFTLPIEQIPSWDADKAQILCHYKTGGLVWLTPVCVQLRKCSGSGNESSSSSCACPDDECSYIYVLKDNGIVSSGLSMDTMYIFDESNQMWVSVPPSG